MMKKLPIILIILFCCFLANASPFTICYSNPEHNEYDYLSTLYFGPNSEYYEDWSNFHLGWYNPDSFNQIAMTYSNQKYGVCADWCDSIVQDNVEDMAQDFLWDEKITTKGTKWRFSCGGEIKCEEPLLAANVRCSVEQADCDSPIDKGCNATYLDITKVFYLECRGDINCKLEYKPANECCIVTNIRIIHS